MPLSALSDPAAVLQAMAEFDALGRKAFLDKHGYRPARAYVLVHDGKRYDSKAIAGVAHGLQHPLDGPLAAAAFSGGEATVRAKLEQLGFKVEAGTAGPRRNPDWTREETILALDLYLRRRPNLPGEADPQVIQLSALLRQNAAQCGVQGNANFRNPNGVSMKIGNLNRLDGQDDRKGLPHGAGSEERVWAEFMPDVDRLHAAAALIRDRIQAGGVSDPPTPAPSLTIVDAEVSRGPRPAFGEVVHTRLDGDTCVYVMRLHGPVAGLFPGRDLHGMAVLKVGRSNDVDRRRQELNSGFPPGLGLEWRLETSRLLSSGDAAHDVEQALLQDLRARGHTIGGEFAVAPDAILAALIVELADPSEQSSGWSVTS